MQSKIHSIALFKEMQNLRSQLHHIFESVSVSTTGSLTVKKKTQTECTSFNPNMYFLYYTWMSISQISSSSKWDRWETLPPAESQSLSEIQSLGPNKGDSNSPVLVSNRQSVVIKQRTQNDPTKSVFFYSNCTSWNSTQAAPQPGLKNSAPEFHPRPQLSNRL